MTRRWVDHHPRRLVEDHDVRILVDDEDWQGLRLRSGGGGLGYIDRVRLVLVDGSARPHLRHRPVHVSILDEPLNLGARLLRQKRRQEVVETHAVVLGLDDQLPPGRRIVFHGIRPRGRAGR